MTDSTSDTSLPHTEYEGSIDECVDALGQTLAMLKAGESDGGPSLAEIMRFVRVMENQPEHAMEKLKHSLDSWSDVPTPEKIRRSALLKMAHNETSLKALPDSERDAIEARIAEDIRHHFGISRLPVRKTPRPSPPQHPAF